MFVSRENFKNLAEEFMFLAQQPDDPDLTEGFGAAQPQSVELYLKAWDEADFEGRVNLMVNFTMSYCKTLLDSKVLSETIN